MEGNCLICWIKIYLLDSAIRLFNSWGLVIISGQVVRIGNGMFFQNLRVKRSDNRNMAAFTGYYMNAYNRAILSENLMSTFLAQRCPRAEVQYICLLNSWSWFGSRHLKQKAIEIKVTRKGLAWENSRLLPTLPLVSLPNDFWETSAEILSWWRVTSQIWVVLLIG